MHSHHRGLTPFQIAAIYAILGGLWVFGSDYLLSWLVGIPSLLTRLQTFKGWFYVIATTGLLYILIERSVSAARRSKTALTESEARYSSLFENNHAVMMLIDPETADIVDANPAACFFYGYSREELKRKKITDINVFTPQQLMAEMEKAKTTQRQHFYFRHRLANGEIRDVEVYSGPILIHAKQLLYSIVHDITQRKQAEERLENSERKFRAVFENANDAILLMTENTFIDCNRRAEEMFGCSREQILQKTLYDLSPAQQPDGSESKTKALEKIRAALAGKPQFFEWRHKKLEDRFIETEVSLNRIELDGKMLVQAIVRDVTERKQAEEELHRRNRELALFNRIIAASTTGQELEVGLETVCQELATTLKIPHVIALLLDETRTEAHIAAEYVSGGQPALLNLTIPVAGSVLLQYLLDHKAPLTVENTTDEAVALPMDRLRVDSLIRAGNFVSLLIAPLMIEDEVVGGLGLVGSEAYHYSTDTVNLVWRVADQVAGALARARLAQTGRRLITAIEQAAESIIITDTSGSIIYVNPAFEHISGYSPAEVLGQNPRILKSGHHDAAFYKNLWSTIKAGQTWHGRIVNRRKDGTLYTLDATISPVRDEQGIIVNYVDVGRDVSAELLLEERYRQAQKMEAVGRLAGGIAHDFNNILTVIAGYSGLLLARHPDKNDPHYKDIDQIRQAAERAAALVRQLLIFSRKQVLQPEVLDLNGIVVNMENILRRLIGEDIDLAIVLDPALGRVKADPSQLEQVIMNLAVNARDAMPYGGRLMIETANVYLDGNAEQSHPNLDPGPYVRMAVSDTGVGIDEETLSHLFEPFFTTKEAGKGTGLGLATVYGIVQQSGGDIWVYSEPGQGATFKIYLPQVQEDLEPSFPKQSSSSFPQGTETILLVEDEHMVRELAYRILAAAGYTILTAANGFEALQLAEQDIASIQLLITDVIMPGMSGRELAEKLTSIRPQIKVLYMSGYTDNFIVQRGILDSKLAFIQKPFSPSSLTGRVREVLDT